MADVKDGVGVYLSVYLLTVHKWDPSQIGVVVAIPWIVSILAQSPVGGFIDRTKRKRLLLVVASAIVALSCIIVVNFPAFYPIAASQVALGVVQTVFPPCVAAITLGMVGRQSFPKRIGRNESFNHGGNMLAAVAAVFIGWYISYEGIFYFSILQCAAIIVATLLIREKEIDHDLAREATEGSQPADSFVNGLKQLFSNRDVTYFTIAVGLWNIANGAMLPLLGQKIGLSNLEHSALYLSVCIIIAQMTMVFIAPLAAKLSEYGRKTILTVAFILVPVRALLFAWIDNKYALISFQVIDGIGAGIYGVISILMMADLGKGTGRFNLLQGTTYASIGLGVALSSILSGYMVKYFGYAGGFISLAGMGTVATLFLLFFVKESMRPTRTNQLLDSSPVDFSKSP